MNTLIFGITLIICLTVIVIIALIKRCSCEHQWETTAITDFTIDGYHKYRKYYLRCKKCGTRKSVKL